MPTAAVRCWCCLVQMQLCSRVVRQNELSLATLSNEPCSVSRFPTALSWVLTFNMLTEVWWERCCSWVFGAMHSLMLGEFAGASAPTGSCPECFPLVNNRSLSLFPEWWTATVASLRSQLMFLLHKLPKAAFKEVLTRYQWYSTAPSTHLLNSYRNTQGWIFGSSHKDSALGLFTLTDLTPYI